ncbi:MAG: aminotransferase class I/II-fold pyridoxal phosphate-dependent enzyme [Sphaerochaetaceae bacterium]|jgi:aspartate/methionine/tyrosine aminotransferase
MNPLAQQLNQTLSGTIVDDMLSDYGRRMYFPKGIISQSAEAKQKATRFNATIGIATEHGKAMHLPSVYACFSPEMGVDELFPYAPTAGEMALRKKWLEEMRVKNPPMKDATVSLPIVTSGLTHAISVAASLFIDKDQQVLCPDMYWGNYNLIFTEQRQAKMVSFPLFFDGKLNIAGLSKAIDDAGSDRIAMILNFPNNPAGYTPTETEMEALAAMLIQKADDGKKLLVFTDDAYFGLFFEPDVCTHSLFSKLCNAHENILAVKGDAATKEEMVWGFRIGFITYGSKNLTEDQYAALEKKTMGAIRGVVSSCDKPGQSILLRAMQDGSYHADKAKGIATIGKRYAALKQELAKHAGDTALMPLPFNSGYFMSFVCSVDAEELRLRLLDKYQTGTISIQGKYLRLAFSSIDLENIPALIDTVYKAAHE